MSRAALRLALAGSCVAIAACGGSEQTAQLAARSGALPLSAQVPSGAIARATPADFRAPIAAYRAHVGRELAAMDLDVRRLSSALRAAEGQAARAAWRAAAMRYGRIGAAYGAFGDLDAAVAGTPAGLPRAAADPGFTGLHRVELELYGRKSLTGARRATSVLQRSLALMRTRLPRIEIEPLEYSLRVHEILEDTLHVGLTGQQTPWSRATYDGVAASAEGVGYVLRTLRPMIVARNATTYVQAERDLHRLRTALRPLRRGAVYLTADQVRPTQRERVAALVAASAESLAALPELIDPRPPLPPRSPYGRPPR